MRRVFDCAGSEIGLPVGADLGVAFRFRKTASAPRTARDFVPNGWPAGSLCQRFAAGLATVNA